MNNSLADIVKEFGSAIIFTRGAKLDSSSGIYYLDIIYGMSSDENDIRYRNQIYLDRIPRHTYTFGESPEGDQFCISSKTNEIYCWKHDAIDGSDSALMASSFIEFIRNLVAD